MKNTILSLLAAGISCIAFGQQYRYAVNLNIKKDQVPVELACPPINQDEILFSFPKTVPGTYAVLDYGRYITAFKAQDAAGKKLVVKKIGNNDFRISGARNLKKISYLVNDSWDAGEKKNKIFEPAGSGFEKGKYFVLNNGAMFGAFTGMIHLPYEITFQKPANMTGYSSMKGQKESQTEKYSAADYHALMDNPILFTTQQPAYYQMGNCRITIASYYDQDSASYYTQKAVIESFKAIEKFTEKVPVDEYTVLLFIQDQQKAGEILESGNFGLKNMLKLKRLIGDHAYGALEHPTSSLYFLPDFGRHSYPSMLKEVVIHEFMHIYTPLNLHSQYIGDFNYQQPVMSKHLWLYEGITEYFAVQIRMQGGLETVEATLEEQLKPKIVNAAAYPDSIPFTVMSANVFDEPYKDLYNQVYERGAIMGMLLDFEIMRLTDGKMTLKTAVFELCKRYGPNKSFDEETFIREFVALVHPDLQNFFDKYVTGNEHLGLDKGFETVGIEFHEKRTGRVPVNLLDKTESGAEATMGIVINGRVTVKTANAGNTAGFQKDDKVSLKEITEAFQNESGEYIPEGEIVELEVIRNDQPLILKFPAKYKDGTTNNESRIMPNPSPQQQKLFQLWTTGKL